MVLWHPSDSFASVETGEPIGYLEWNDDVIRETGADFLVMHVRPLVPIVLLSH